MKREVKRVLMFHGGDICYNTLNIFTDTVADGLKAKGIDVGFINLNLSGEKLVDEYVREINLGFDAALSFNSGGQHETSMGDSNIYEYMNAPFFNWIVDHPCNAVPDIESDLKNYHVICIDRDHQSFLNKYFPKLSGAHFIPLGGIEKKESQQYMDICNREYDVAFIGSYFPLDNIGEEIGNLPDPLKNSAIEMIELMLDNRGLTYEQACKIAYENSGLKGEISFLEFSYLTCRINRYITQYMREEAIRYLAASGITIHLFGNGWDVLDDLGKNVIVHGGVSYQESFEIYQNTKICLNVMPWFKDGFHDRIASIMNAGSVVMTDSSRYLDEVIAKENGEVMILYDITKPQEVGDIVKSALDDTEHLDSIAMAGEDFSKRHFGWETRVDELIKIIQESL